MRNLTGRFGIIAVLCASTVAQAEKPVTYIALGDSIPFGLNPTLLPPYAPLDLNNFKGYPVFVADALKEKLTNASRVGETTASYLSGQIADQLPYPLWSPTYPTFVTYGPGQFSQDKYAMAALDNHIKLVTLNIGGNDLGVLQVQCGFVEACVTAGLPGTLLNAATNLNKILKHIRRDADYDRTLVVMTYYAFNYNDIKTVQALTLLNTAIAGLTHLYGGQVADGFGAFLKASLPFGGDACAAGLLVPIGVGQCDTHPSLKGQQVLAGAVLDAIGK